MRAAAIAASHPACPGAHHNHIVLFDKNHLKLFYGFLDDVAEWNGLPDMDYIATRCRPEQR